MPARNASRFFHRDAGGLLSESVPSRPHSILNNTFDRDREICTTIRHLLVFLTRFYHSVIPMKMGIQIFLLILDSRLDPAFAARSFASAE